MTFTQTLDDYFTELTQADKFSGVVLITQGENRLYERPFGLASRSWNIPNRLDVRFDTASITKLFTAVATLQCIDQGHFTLQTSAIDYLGLTDTTISPQVTVYHLLTHTSGIGDDVEEEDGEDYADLWVNKPNYSITETVDFLPQFIHKPPNFPPGTGCRYCNCSFVLLGLMVEKATGLSYRDYVGQHIFAPAGMVDSGFFRMDQVYPNGAAGCDPIEDENGRITGWQKNIYSYPPIGSPDGGAHVTAVDLNRFLRAVQAGQLLSPAMTQAFLSPHVHYRDKEGWTMQYGFGLWFYVADEGKIVCYQKEGINAGTSGIVRYFPEQDINVILLSNMMGGVWQPIWKIHELIMADK